MPVQKGKSGLASKLGGKLKTAHEEHKEDELQLQGGGNLPEGIDNGVAQLVMMKFDTYKTGDNKGEYYFMAQGVVVLPKTVNGIPVAGERTKIGPEPICDTPKGSGKRKTMSDHYGWVLNEIRKFGVDTKEVEFENIEAVATMLQEQQPHFKFRTWKGEATEQFPNPRVNEDWRGVCEFNAETEDQVQDNSGGAKGGTKEEAPAEESTTESEPEASNGDAVDYDALAATADDANAPDKDDAARVIVEACNSAGISTEDTDKLPNWEAVVALLKEKIEGNGQASSEEIIPKAKQVMHYRPMDAKTKKPAKKPIECEVTAVFDKNKTCNLRNLDDGKTTYKAVAWTDLAPV